MCIHIIIQLQIYKPKENESFTKVVCLNTKVVFNKLKDDRKIRKKTTIPKEKMVNYKEREFTTETITNEYNQHGIFNVQL